MQIILSSAAAAGLIGVSNQYLFVLLLGLLGRFGLFRFPNEMSFMTGNIFLGVVGALWILSIAPAYSSMLAPGIGNAVNTVSNFVHGFVVPGSAALTALATAGIIANVHPELRSVMEAIRVFQPDGGIGTAGVVIASAGAIAATGLTITKAAAKPGLSASTGTTGHAAAPIFATLENIGSVVMVGLFWVLTNIDPRLIIGLFAVLAILCIGTLIYACYLLWRLGTGIGHVLRLMEQQPKVGWAIALEAITWGGGSFIWRYESRGWLRAGAWVLWVLFIAVVGLPSIFVPFIGVLIVAFQLSVWVFVGIRSARSLLRMLDQDGHVKPLANVATRKTAPEAIPAVSG